MKFILIGDERLVKEGTIRQGKMVFVYCDYNIYGMLRNDYEGLQRKNS